MVLIKYCRYILRSMEYGQILKTDKCKCRKVQLLNDDQCMPGLRADYFLLDENEIGTMLCYTNHHTG